MLSSCCFSRRNISIVRNLFLAQSLLLMLVSIATAQVDSTDKRLPETRQLEFPLDVKDSSATTLRAAMPKIDLPEYEITGNAVIDLPGAEKLSAPEDTQSSRIGSLLGTSLNEDRETAQISIGNKESSHDGVASLFNGRATASIGTFFSPKAGLWFGHNLGDLFYLIDGEYYRTKGFAPYTDRSGGSLDLIASTTMNSYNPWFDRSNIHVELTYKSDTYNWYGTRTPSLGRNRTDFTLSGDLVNWVSSPMLYEGEFGYENFEVDDSSRAVVETNIRLGGAAGFPVYTVPLTVRLAALVGSISRQNSTSGLSFVDLSIGSQRYAWKSISMEGSIHAYLASGMVHQKLARLYPHLYVAYQLNDQNNLSASYAPKVEPLTLSSRIFANRYLSAESDIKHTDDQQDANLALETDWSAATRTRFEARVQSISDFPLYADSLSRKSWLIAYGGRTTIASFSGEIFAKLTANDYFALKLTASISKNSKTGTEVPYLPGFEIGARYVKRFLSSWTGIATLTLLHQGVDNVIHANTLPSIFLIGLRGEYQLFHQAALFLDVENLLNQQYQYWSGYQETPFVLSAGISLRW